MTTSPELRARLADARLMLVFTPSLCGARDPLAVLEDALPAVDVVQVRPKARDQEVTAAEDVHALTLAVLDLVAGSGRAQLVLVNDRVDVAAALLERGCHGVHVGQDDCPPDVARAVLGGGALIGLSTHDARQIALALGTQADYLGFGPYRATSTKGYAHGVGPERTWVAATASDRPVFPIGGIDRECAGELERIGRAAVSAAILSADDPGRVAREIRALLLPHGSSNIASP